MHLVVLFHNIGGYHAARLRAAHDVCRDSGGNLTAIQVTDNSQEHPWGDLEREITFNLRTLLPIAAVPSEVHRQQNSVAAAKAISAVLNEIRPDVVAIPGWGFRVARRALSWCKRSRRRAILMSESKHDDDKRRWWKEKIKSDLYISRFHSALVGGRLHFDYLVKLGMPKERIFYGYDVVDNKYFAESAEAVRRDDLRGFTRPPLVPTLPFFLSVTRLIPRKNILRLVHAYAAYRQQVGEEQAWDLVVCGSGVAETEVRQATYELRLDAHVHFPGFVGYQEIGAWYGLAEAFIHPALQEQWGLVVNEACAAGLPILCSRTVGASYDLVKDGENGFLFDPHCVENIANAMVLVHRSGKPERQAMGKLSQYIISSFSPRHFAEGLMKAATLKVV